MIMVTDGSGDVVLLNPQHFFTVFKHDEDLSGRSSMIIFDDVPKTRLVVRHTVQELYDMIHGVKS